MRVFRQLIAPVLCVSLVASTSLAQQPPRRPAPPPVQPAPPPGPKPLAETLEGDARADYLEGKNLYGVNDFAGALLKFQSAFAKSKDPRLLWNIGVCEKNLRHYTKALGYITRYAEEGGALITDQDRADAASLVAGLKPLVANVVITVSEPGAEVFLDDESVGRSPLETLRVDLGKHVIRAKKDGFRELTTPVTVDGASDVKVDVKLERDVHEGRLVVHAGATDAISLDGKVVASGRWESVLPSGGHTLRVTAQGMRRYQTEVTILDNQTRTVDVTLEPEVKPAAGIPAWVWIGGGALLATGAVIGGYFIFKPSDTTAPPTAGSVPPGTVQVPSWRFR